jgi:lipopolysaccharide export system permease protein
MNLIDRYIVSIYIKIFLVSFVSMSGLFVVIDTFTNLEEFINLGKESGGLFAVLGEYYGPRILQFYDRMAPVLALIAGICTLTWLQRTNELTAIEAIGISKARVAKSVLIASAVVVLLAVANRECLIPTVRQSLVRNAQSWSDEKPRTMRVHIDPETQVILRGDQVIPAERIITHPDFQTPVNDQGDAIRIRAEIAVQVDHDEHHPMGFILQNVSSPVSFEEINSYRTDDGWIFMSPEDQDWLNQGECFVVCDTALDMLVDKDALARYMSVPELVQLLHRPSQSFSNRQKVDLHSRFVRPFLDYSIFLIALPIVVGRREQKLLATVGFCLLLICAWYLVTWTSHSLGSARLVKPAALAAWIPVIIFVPITVLTFGRLYR